MRVGRILRRMLIGAVVLAVAVVVVAVVVSQTAAFREWLRRQIVARLGNGLNGEISLGVLDGNLLQGVELTDLRVRSEGRRVLAARRVAARYDLLGLVTGGGLTLRDVEIQGLALTLVEDERGWNVARLYGPAPEPHEPSTLEVTLDRARIAGAAIKLVRPADVWRARNLDVAGSARFGPNGQALTLDAASCVLPGRGVRVTELTGKVAVAADGGTTVDALHVRTDASELRVDARVPAGDGSYDVTVEVPHLAAEEVRRLLRRPAPATDLSATLHLRGPATWAAVDARVTSAAGTVALDGHVGRADPPSYDLHATLDAVNAAGFAGPAQPATDLTGTIDVQGKGVTLAEASAHVALALRDSMVSGRKIARLSVGGDVAAEQVTFDASAAIEGGDAEARGTVAIAAERYDVRLQTRSFDPAPLIGRPDLHAQLNATLIAAGTGFTPATARAEAHLVMTPSRLERVDVTSAAADVRIASGTLTIERLRVDASALALDASGTLALDEHAAPATGTLRFAVRARDLAPVAQVAGIGPLAGTAAIDGTASGGLGDLAVQATLTGRQLARAGTLVGSVTATVSGRGLGGPRGAADLDAHATDVHAGGRRFAALDVDAHWQQQAAGASAARLTARATEDERHRHELVASAALGTRERRVTVEALRLDLGDDTWRADGTPVLTQRGERFAIDGFLLRSPRGVVSVEGEGGTTGAEDLTVRIDGLDLEMLSKTVQAKLAGRIGASAHLGGSAAAPAIEAHVTIAAPTVEGVRYESAALDATVGAGRATVAARVVQDGPRQLSVNVATPLRLALAPFSYAAPGTLSGDVRATAIDLAFLDPLVPQVSKLAGTLEAELDLSGTLADPQIHGPLAITGGRAYVVALGVTYDPIELRMTLAGPAASIETLRVASGNGTLTGGGSAHVAAEGATIDTRLRLDRFPFLANEFGEGVASGSIAITGTTAAPSVDGALTTDRFVLRIPESLPGSIRPPDPTVRVVGPAAEIAPAVHPAAATADAAAPAPQLPTPGIYDRATIGIKIDIPNNAWIRRSDANIELRGWMAVAKKPSEKLALTGEINTVRGWYSFQGKTFTIEDGRVTFTGSDFDPVIELTAAHTAGDYTVRVKVGGHLTKPTLTLESDPPLDQADVLSVLLFGKPTSELSQNESAGLREQAIGVASSYVAGQLRQSVADALGVDTLQFESGSEGLQGSSVSLGKYVAPDVFVSLAHRFARQGVQEIRIEYRVTPRWSIESSSDTLGDSGIDVFWKSRY